MPDQILLQALALNFLELTAEKVVMPVVTELADRLPAIGAAHPSIRPPETQATMRATWAQLGAERRLVLLPLKRLVCRAVARCLLLIEQFAPQMLYLGQLLLLIPSIHEPVRFIELLRNRLQATYLRAVRAQRIEERRGGRARGRQGQGLLRAPAR